MSKHTQIFCFALGALLLALCSPANAQQGKIYRIGVLVPGSAWSETVDGLRIGLKELGLEEGKQFILAIHDWNGDAKAAQEAARKLEQEKADLIYATSTGGTIAAKRATAQIPIVFSAGTDPVKLGLVQSFASPGGRLTGVHYRVTDLTAKRLELLRDIVPNLPKVVTFYDPGNPVGIESSKLAREAARSFAIELIERQVATSQKMAAAVRALKTGEMDAYFAVSDPLAANQAQLIIDTAKAKKIPTMFDFLTFAFKGGLGSYAVSFQEVGRISAKYVQRVLAGVKPKDLPVEGIDKIELVINQQTAKQIGLTIPLNVLARVDKVIR